MQIWVFERLHILDYKLKIFRSQKSQKKEAGHVAKMQVFDSVYF